MSKQQKMVFGGTHQFGQKCIHQQSIAVNSRFEPYNPEESAKTLANGDDDIEVGMITFCRTRKRAVGASAKKRHRSAEYAMPISSTRRQQGVFANLAHVPSRHAIHFAGVAENEITVRTDHWRYANGTAITVVLAGTVTVMNTGPHDIFEGEWVYWDLPALHGDYAAMAGEKTCHRAILLPITAENVASDPTAIYRTVGKCLQYSQAGSMLDLSVSTAVAPIPFGLNNNFYKALSQVLNPPAAPAPSAPRGASGAGLSLSTPQQAAAAAKQAAAEKQNKGNQIARRSNSTGSTQPLEVKEQKGENDTSNLSRQQAVLATLTPDLLSIQGNKDQQEIELPGQQTQQQIGQQAPENAQATQSEVVEAGHRSRLVGNKRVNRDALRAYAKVDEEEEDELEDDDDEDDTATI